jgi:solute:Na+ symporter, SSS family
MRFSVWDWAIVAAFLAVVLVSAGYTRRLVHNVADFLAGGRLAGRYLLTIAGQMGALGAVSIIAQWEASYHSGWGGTFWAVILAPVWIVITLSGWVVYRFRETRALTLAQFFEERYSRRFRVFAGLLAFVSGVLNYGIFPSVAARFLIYFAGLPECPVELGGMTVSLTYAGLMALLLGLALWITLAGGQVAVMTTDVIQGLLCLLIAVGLTFYCISRVGWDQIAGAVALAPDPENASMIHPFKTAHVRDFNIGYYLIATFSAFYSCMAWQGSSGYNAAPRTPHEARMARVLATWRSGTLLLVIGFMAMAAYAVMHHPDFTGLGAAAGARLDAIADPAVRKQMIVPVALSELLPAGMLGLLAAIVLAAAVTTDDTYLHSWGSIFIQDVVLPLRGGAPLPPETHLRWLRWSIAGVAVFAYAFSFFLVQRQLILMFMATMGSIFLGGAGSAIIGGLYWRRGTTTAAWGAMLTGLGLALGAIGLQYGLPFHRMDVAVEAPGAIAVQVDGAPARPAEDGRWTGRFAFWRAGEWQPCLVVAHHAGGGVVTQQVHYAHGPMRPPDRAAVAVAAGAESLRIEPADLTWRAVGGGRAARLWYGLRSRSGQVLYFWTMLGAMAVYIILSLFGRTRFDLERLLHRGVHAVGVDHATVAPPVRGWRALAGITNEFTRGDRIIYWATLVWSVGWIVVYIVLIAINAVKLQPDGFWVNYHRIKFYIILCVGLGTTAWFTVGGARDLIRMVRALRELARRADEEL